MRQPQQTLKPKDLLYALLKAWRSLILFALIGALLMGALAFYRGGKGSQTPNLQRELTSKEIDAITKEVMTGNPEAVRRSKRVESLVSRMAYIGDALANSHYLTIDGKAQLLLTYKLKFSPQRPGPQAEETYEDRLYLLSLNAWKSFQSEEFYQYLYEETGGQVALNWLPELVATQLEADHSIKVQVTAAEEELALSLAVATQAFIESQILQYLEMDFPFEMTLTSLDRQLVENPAIEARRRELEQELFEVAAIREEESAKIALILEEALLDAQLGDATQEDAPQADSSAVSRRSLIKFMLVGAFLGAVLAGLLAILKILSSGLVFNPEDLANRLELFYIGSAKGSSGLAPRAFGGGIDRWLEGLFYGGKSAQARYVSPDYLASLISRIDLPLAEEDKRGEEERSGKIVILGDLDDPLAQELTQALDQEMSDRAERADLPPQAQLAELGSAEGLEALKASQAAVLLIPARKMKLNRVLRQLDLVSAAGKQVLGLVSSDI